MRKYAVVVAGGSGTRMKTTVPKQFLNLHGKPVLYYSFKAFFDAYTDINLILVLPAEHLAAGRDIVNEYFSNHAIIITIGGSTRFHSVQNGLKHVQGDSVVFVHDAVRCVLTPALIRCCYDAVIEFGSAVPVVTLQDSIRHITVTGHEAVDRTCFRAVQTPQAFKSNVLLQAFDQNYDKKFTDEATVVEAFGEIVHLVEGEETNIKITRPIDLDVAAAILQRRQNTSESEA